MLRGIVLNPLCTQSADCLQGTKHRHGAHVSSSLKAFTARPTCLELQVTLNFASTRLSFVPGRRCWMKSRQVSLMGGLMSRLSSRCLKSLLPERRTSSSTGTTPLTADAPMEAVAWQCFFVPLSHLLCTTGFHVECTPLSANQTFVERAASCCVCMCGQVPKWRELLGCDSASRTSHYRD